MVFRGFLVLPTRKIVPNLTCCDTPLEVSFLVCLFGSSPATLTSIDVKFIFDSARLALFSSAILQIADVALRVLFLLFLPCFQVLFRLVLTLEKSEMSAIIVFTTKATQRSPQRESLMRSKVNNPFPSLVAK